MSLIQDALKRKTEEQNPLPAAPPPEQPAASKEAAPPPTQPAAPKEPATSKKTPPPPAPEPIPETLQDNSSTRKLFIILSASIVLILLIIGSSIYLVINQSATDETLKEIEATEPPVVQAALTPAVAPAPAPKPAPEPAPKPAPKKVTKDKWPELTFSGSAVGGNEILAIINGRMLSVGSQLRGVKVLQIGKNEVLVEFEGEKRILRVDDQ
ncbi:MAG: hypothetical protein ISR84_04770 [Kiritimatiellales bacterium]|nr:hypothetical protein [Kiritimatiellota bacterium]MBL7016853.1 hypothetical protein [Kiritimatiellales bacterium]